MDGNDDNTHAFKKQIQAKKKPVGFTKQESVGKLPMVSTIN